MQRLLSSPKILSLAARQKWLSAAMDKFIAPEDGEGMELEVVDWNAPLLGACEALGVSSVDGQLTTARPARLQTVRTASSSAAGDAAAGDGLRREWLQAVSGSLIEPNHGLFVAADDGRSFLPNEHSAVLVPDHMAQFALLGRLIGLALLHGEQLGKSAGRLNPAILVQLLGLNCSDEDILAFLDPEKVNQFQQARQHVKSGGQVDDWGLSFSLTDASLPEYMKQARRCDRSLTPGGSQVMVTNEKLEEYLKLAASCAVQRWRQGIDCQLAAMASGLGVLLPAPLLAKVGKAFYVEELLKLLGGDPVINDSVLADWKKHTDYSGGLSAEDQLSQWFWRALASFGSEQRAQLLQFATSSPCPPALGFSRLPGGPFRLERSQADVGRLPTASTCFCILRLPAFSSYEDLRAKLLLAVQGSKGFAEAAVAEAA
ncbi:unnamed protein product [Polarella glacialis]|uniref:HECT-type E3 ubiquitin transferase n=1 Tax=Polarella glacialis TaxID=89957 RepID=A0A813KE24_POLGL|nr:unnamed protein product [Polarella glacialis]